MDYKWRRKLAPIDAQVVGEELESIRQKGGGRLIPKAVVDDARPATSPLHPAFEWDDSVAGEEYRIHQARQIIRAVHVVVEDNGESTNETRPVFVHIDKGADKYYQAAAVAVTNVDEFQAALKELVKKVAGAQKALRDLRNTAKDVGVVGALNKAGNALESAKKVLAEL